MSARPARVLVTGAGSGLGLVIAKAFAATGAHVHIADIDADAIAEMVDAGHIDSGSALDWSTPVRFSRLLADVRERLGGMDVLVYNVCPRHDGAPDASASGVRQAKVFRDVAQAIQNGRAARDLLAESRTGALIFVAPHEGTPDPHERDATSQTRGTRFRGLARRLSLENGPSFTTCNTVLVGPMLGPNVMNGFDLEAVATARPVTDVIASKLASQPIKLLADPLDVAALSIFLAGTHARNLTGQSFVVGGIDPE